MINELIYDRTQADADRWQYLKSKGFAQMNAEERAEWLSDVKGAYNATDLNRVEEAMQYIAGRFREYGYSLTLHAPHNWTISDIPKKADIDGYLGDVRALRGIAPVLLTTPQAPGSMEHLTWSEANDIEKILVDIDDLLTKMSCAFRHCGAATCGMGGLIR